MSPGQRWRRKRDLTLYVAWRSGLSQRCLADVFDLARSRVSRIVAGLVKDDPSRADRKTGRGPIDGRFDAFERWLASEVRKTQPDR